jgi:HlyD family secretion protein
MAGDARCSSANAFRCAAVTLGLNIVENAPKASSVHGQPLVKRMPSAKVWSLVVAIAAILALSYGWFASHAAKSNEGGEPPSATESSNSSAEMAQSSDSSLPRLDVVRPRVGGVVNSTTQPATVEAYNYANLFAKVSGYLGAQSVDIGDRVKEGQVLAQIDAPEIVQAANQATAELEQAQTQLKVNAAALESAKADVAVARAMVAQKRADLKQAIAFFEFHQVQFSRLSDLFKQKAIDERLVDENRKERDSAEAARNLAEADVRTAQADLGAKQALEQQADATVADARAKVQVASAVLEKAKVYVSYTQIRSPYNGVVSKRDFHVGDFVRAAEDGGHIPVLTVTETDVMRVVVKVPEDFVPLTRPGDSAEFKLSYTDHVYEGKVARVANSLDREDKTMRTEIDLPNPDNELRDGMFGYATIELSKTLKGLSVPSSSVVNSGLSSAPAVFVVRDGRLRRIPVRVTIDTGVRAEVLSGLRPDDWVVVKPTEDLTEGQAVHAVEVQDSSATPTKRSR